MSLVERLLSNDPELVQVVVDRASLQSDKFFDALQRNTVAEEILIEHEIFDPTSFPFKRIVDMLYAGENRTRVLMTVTSPGVGESLQVHFNVPLSPNFHTLTDLHLFLTSLEDFRRECLPRLPAFVSLETLDVIFAHPCETDTFIEFCGILSRLPRLKTIRRLFGHMRLDKLAMEAVVQMVSTSKTIEAMPEREYMFPEATNSDFDERCDELTFYCLRNRVHNQHVHAQTTKVLAGASPAGLLPLVLERLSTEGWLDVMSHIVREKHDVLINRKRKRDV